MLYNSPFAVAILIFALVLGLVGAVRHLFRTGANRGELQEAEKEGRLSPVIREIWERDRKAFAFTLVGIVAFLGWLVWVVDHDLQP